MGSVSATRPSISAASGASPAAGSAVPARVGRARRGGHEQRALGAEALHERRRRDAGLAGDVGQRQARGTDGADGAEGGVEQRVVGMGARAAGHL